jgi:hypothetical protein
MEHEESIATAVAAETAIARVFIVIPFIKFCSPLLAADGLFSQPAVASNAVAFVASFRTNR